jgi:DNA mismatch repair protein MutS
VAAIAEFIQPIQHNAFILAQIDCLLGFSILANENQYNKPTVNEGYDY